MFCAFQKSIPEDAFLRKQNYLRESRFGSLVTLLARHQITSRAAAKFRHVLVNKTCQTSIPLGYTARKIPNSSADDRIPPLRESILDIGTEHGSPSCGLRCRTRRTVAALQVLARHGLKMKCGKMV